MFPRRSLEFIILSILKEQGGLSGYQILKIVQNSFTFYRRLSPGTFYHQLEKLSKQGDIEQKGDDYFISEQGVKKIETDIPEMMNKSMEYLPHLMESLMGSLSKMMQMEVFPKLSCFMGHSLYDVDIFSDEKIDFSIDKLIIFKRELENSKRKLQGRIKSIDEKIKRVNDQIKKLQKVKDEPIQKVNVEDGDKEKITMKHKKPRK